LASAKRHLDCRTPPRRQTSGHAARAEFMRHSEIESHFADAEAAVEKGEERLRRQKELIADMERHGRTDALAPAVALLVILEEIQRKQIKDRNRLRREISRREQRRRERSKGSDASAQFTARIVNYLNGADLGPIDMQGARDESEAVEIARIGAIAATKNRGVSRAYVLIKRQTFTVRRLEVFT
jgi:hypothetical protein